MRFQVQPGVTKDGRKGWALINMDSGTTLNVYAKKTQAVTAGRLLAGWRGTVEISDV